jgi:hypothetical protein
MDGFGSTVDNCGVLAVFQIIKLWNEKVNIGLGWD